MDGRRAGGGLNRCLNSSGLDRKDSSIDQIRCVSQASSASARRDVQPLLPRSLKIAFESKSSLEMGRHSQTSASRSCCRAPGFVKTGNRSPQQGIFNFVLPRRAGIAWLRQSIHSFASSTSSYPHHPHPAERKPRPRPAIPNPVPTRSMQARWKAMLTAATTGTTASTSHESGSVSSTGFRLLATTVRRGAAAAAANAARPRRYFFPSDDEAAHGASLDRIGVDAPWDSPRLTIYRDARPQTTRRAPPPPLPRPSFPRPALWRRSGRRPRLPTTGRLPTMTTGTSRTPMPAPSRTGACGTSTAAPTT